MHLKLKFIGLLVIMSISFTSFSQNPKGFSDMAYNMADKKVSLIFEHQVKKLQEEGKTIVFIDTREKKEYQVSHIKGAVYVGYDDFDTINLENINKNAIIVAYCSVGYRSGKIGVKLMDLGYSNIFNLFGGIFSWANNSNPIYLKEKEVKKVHPYNDNWGKWLNTKYWK
jgi:rhodanese-related sulfurtransferase